MDGQTDGWTDGQKDRDINQGGLGNLAHIDILSHSTSHKRKKMCQKIVTEKNISYIKKYLFLMYSIYHGIPLLPPMDLAHAHVQMK
jgi:hypothetical protein